MNESREAEKKLKLSSQIIENTPEGVLVTDRDNKIIFVNDSFLKTTGYLKKDVVGSDPNILKSNHYKHDFYEKMWNSINKKGVWQGEIWHRKKNGEIYPEWLNIITIYSDRVKGEVEFYVGMFSDLSTRKYIRDQIRHLAYYDSLTNIPNRELFRSKAKSLIINTDIKNKGCIILMGGFENKLNKKAYKI